MLAAEFDVAEALSEIVPPEHTLEGETEADTEVGKGFTEATTSTRAEEHPVEALVA